uniref:Uncharacterized protein n=1 Tax=Leptobrachium leishanense TaxID=445787 RepID=A0A8C5PS63_9ANUR
MLTSRRRGCANPSTRRERSLKQRRKNAQSHNSAKLIRSLWIPNSCQWVLFVYVNVMCCICLLLLTVMVS